MKLKTLLISILLFTIAFAQAQKAIEVPMRQSKSNYLLIPGAVLGDKMLQFVVDTAASMTVITPHVRDALGYTAKDGEKIDSYGAGGVIPAQILTLNSLSLGEHKQDNFRVLTLNLSAMEQWADEPLAGILGSDFLHQFNVKLDLPRKSLTLYPIDKPFNADTYGLSGLLKVPFKSVKECFISFKLELNGATVTAILDTGAAGSLINWKAANAAGVSRDAKSMECSQTALGADQKSIDTCYYSFDKLKLQSLEYSKVKLAIADLPAFEKFGLKDQPAMIFGADLLRERLLFIAYGENCFYLSELKP